MDNRYDTTLNTFDTLPFSMEAEQSVLGAVLIEPSCISQVMEYVKPESFYRAQHKELFTIMLRMFTTAAPIDVITVLEEAKKERVFASEDDAKVYLAQLAQIVPSTANIEAYAKVVQEKHYIRSLMQVANEILSSAQDPQTGAKTLMDLAEQKIFEIRKGSEDGGLIRVDRIIFQLYDQLQKLSGDEKSLYAGIPTGFSAVDNITTGLNKSDLVLIAARPAMGKTSFALNIATNVAKAGRSVAIFSLEMSREQLVSRLLSSEALIQGTQMRTGSLKGEDWTKLAMSAQMIAKSPLYIDDTPGITVAEMKARLRRIKDLGVVIIDYLQLMSSNRRTENRVQEVSEITRSLKIMAKELDVPVITLSQLSRGPDSRSEHRPMLSDLRESGSIEQDADLVLFLYRDEYYNRETDDRGTAECIIAKNRHGETGSVKLGWDGQFTRFKTVEFFRDEP